MHWTALFDFFSRSVFCYEDKWKSKKNKKLRISRLQQHQKYIQIYSIKF